MTTRYFFNSKTPPLEDGPDDTEDNIDLRNNETFGSGAVEGDWEEEHSHILEEERKSSLTGSSTISKYLDEEEIELSNQQLAAAVEELVLNSDQDQDAIDPAIVSLRKESRPGPYDLRFKSGLLSPYLGTGENLGSASAYSSSPSLYQKDDMRNIWSNVDQENPLQLERQQLNEKLKKMMQRNEAAPAFEDEAILSAVKTPASVWQVNPNTQSLQRQLFSHKPAMLKAEDLEKNFGETQLRGPSPTFGVTIPKAEENRDPSNPIDRSLPARSVSPIFGSPSSHAMPIGTPPKHIADMYQANKQGLHHMHPHMPHGNFPMPRPVMPLRGFIIPPGQAVPPPSVMMGAWPPHRAPMNHHIAQDIFNKLGISGNKSLPMMSASPPGNMKPIRPGFVQAPRMIPSARIGFNHPPGLRGAPNKTSLRPRFHGPMPPHRPVFSNNPRFAMPPVPMYLGPGHLHPEHSRFVQMRRQMSLRNQHYHGHQGNRMRKDFRGPRDPYSNLMSGREKEWVIKIQMMALQSDRPEIDDYYYQHYITKRLREGGLSLEDDTEEPKRLITPTKANPDNKKYVPVQFTNSLGKLTVSSVYNPRQTIDVVHAPDKEEETTEATDVKHGMNKRLAIYKIIEKAYLEVIVLEELQRGLVGDNEMIEQIKKEKKHEIKKHVSALTETLLLSNDVNKDSNPTNETISYILRIRKGKRLIARVLPFVSKSSALTIIQLLVKQLPTLLKKDLKEGILHELYRPICEILSDLDVDGLIQVASTLLPTLNVSCKDKFGLSIVCKVLSIGHCQMDFNQQASDNEKAWHNFVGCTVSTLLSVTEKTEAMPSLLEKNLADDVITVLKRYCDYEQADNTSEKLKNIQEIIAVFHHDEPEQVLTPRRNISSSI